MTESILQPSAARPKMLSLPARRGLALFFIAFAVGVSDGATPPPAQPIPLPGYLSGYEALYAISPRQAARKWFLEAKYGLMVHYCLASLLDQGKGGYLSSVRRPADVQSPAEQTLDRELFSRFTASQFDAAAIADLAVAGGMKYVTFTTAHLGGLCLWNTAGSDFNSVKSPAHRDLVAEMASACAKRQLGLFLYVPPNTSRTDGEFFPTNRRILTELLGHYGPIAGIWFDGIGAFHQHPERYGRVQELFSLVRTVQPQCLVSWKSSADGTDFLAPEHTVGDLHSQHPELPVEVCTTMQQCSRRDLIPNEAGWINNEAVAHLSADAVVMLIRELQLDEADNILLNIGLRGNGSIHPDDERALRAAGAYRREHWPVPSAPASAPP